MAFDLPDIGHVVYGKQRLTRVLTQLRFNPVLRIASEVPSEFQELVRDLYPLVEQGTGFTITTPSGVVENAVPAFSTDWKFRSADDIWTITLAPNFLAFDTTRYEHFTDFLARFEPVWEAMVGIYRIRSLTRIGLRYSNSFDRPEGLPFDSVRPELRGLLDSPLSQSVLMARNEYVLQDGEDRIGLRFGTVVPGVPAAETDGNGFVLDFDHYREGELDPTTVMDTLRKFHDMNYQLFRWSITNEQHERMEPVDG